jgi:hypothetical protein
MSVHQARPSIRPISCGNGSQRWVCLSAKMSVTASASATVSARTSSRGVDMVSAGNRRTAT